MTKTNERIIRAWVAQRESEHNANVRMAKRVQESGS